MFTRKYVQQVNVQRPFLALQAVLYLCLLLSFISTAPANAGTTSETAIFLPFHVELSGEYSYLRDGLTTVLASRVATRTGIQTVYATSAVKEITRLFQNGREESGFKVFAKSGADYLFMGSVEKSGGKFLFTVDVIARKEGTGVRQFTRSTVSIDDALPAMDDLAWDLSAGVFGVSRPEEIVVDQEKQGSGMSGFQTAHPDRAYKEGMFSGIMPGFDTGGLNLIATKRSPKIPFGINDMDVADLDGDGVAEIVLAATDQLIVYGFVGEYFKQLATIELDSYLRIHAISMADLNGNGVSEIYVSANKAGKPESTVVEWDGRQSRILAKRIPYYLQVAAPDGEPVLLGQIGGTPGTSAVIGADIYRLEQGGDGNYVRGQKLVLPKGLNIFDVAYGDIDGNGEQELVAISRTNTLQVFDRNGVLLFTDPGQYGGSSNYLGTMDSVSKTNRVYVPPRIVIADINGDGIEDIVVGKNRMKVVKYLKQYRYFEGSSMAALSWQQERLVPLWETKKLPEYTIACQVVPLGPEKRKGTKGDFRLFFAQGQNNYSFGFWQTKSTSLFMYEIGLEKTP